MGYFYINVRFVNGEMSGYRATEQPRYSDVHEAYIFCTVDGITVWLPVKNILSVEWKFEKRE